MQVFLGVLTGVGGGVVRDIFANESPVIFMRHFYATASLIGAIVYSLIYLFNKSIAMFVGLILIVTIGVLAAKYKWNLPKVR